MQISSREEREREIHLQNWKWYAICQKNLQQYFIFLVVNQMKDICGTSENKIKNKDLQNNHQSSKPFANISKPLENIHKYKNKYKAMDSKYQ